MALITPLRNALCSFVSSLPSPRRPLIAWRTVEPRPAESTCWRCWL